MNYNYYHDYISIKMKMMHKSKICMSSHKSSVPCLNPNVDKLKALRKFQKISFKSTFDSSLNLNRFEFFKNAKYLFVKVHFRINCLALCSKLHYNLMNVIINAN